MFRERVSEDIYVFTSEMYAQATAGAVVSAEGAVVIDTLAFPVETQEIKDFLEKQVGTTVRYVINTHYHADHTNGNCFFTHAQVIGHKLCRELMDTVGRSGLERAQAEASDLAGVKVVLPTILLDEAPIYLHLGKKTLQIFPTPGHTADSVSVLFKEDRILFAGDMMMPVPYIVDGDPDDMVRSLQALPSMGLENVVQGHGEVILRGEIDEAVKSAVKYLDIARRKVDQAVKRRKPRESLREISIEACGKPRIALSGVVTKLHTANLLSLYDRMTK
jgi:glyoxylase-like metal-dependent hydrolase (beta-lactamase superfamily II)